MNDVTIIDQFLNTFATYIDSGFGLLRGEVAFHGHADRHRHDDRRACIGP